MCLPVPYALLSLIYPTAKCVYAMVGQLLMSKKYPGMDLRGACELFYSLICKLTLLVALALYNQHFPLVSMALHYPSTSQK